jgi:predicted acylesterase/phospholipase RssA
MFILMSNKKPHQRALVLQGGGALGAYEVGAIYEICIKLLEDIKNHGENDQPLFDVVAGTSIGTINGAVLVSQYLEKRKEGLDIPSSWKESVKKLVEFWKYLSIPAPDIAVLSKKWATENAKRTPGVAPKETAYNYYVSKDVLNNGVENVYSKPEVKEDIKFYDDDNKWHKYNNKRLRESIKRFVNFPIATSFDNKEPRLLIVCVDVQEGATVTFDSYAKPDGSRKSEYVYNENSREIGHIIEYEGITLEHVMASCAVPGFFDFEEIEGHIFWDGILLSNTPLKELMEEHKAYWEYKIGPDRLADSIWNEKRDLSVPDLYTYVVNVYQRKQKEIPLDYDAIKNRIQNITYSDKTSYEEWVANLLTDYLDIIEEFIKLGNKNGLRDAIKKILKKSAITKLYSYLPNEQTTYQDLIKRRFRIKVIRIERKDDEHSVYNKTTDFTNVTINRLIEDGKNDAEAIMTK